MALAVGNANQRTLRILDIGMWPTPSMARPGTSGATKHYSLINPNVAVGIEQFTDSTGDRMLRGKELALSSV